MSRPSAKDGDPNQGETSQAPRTTPGQLSTCTGNRRALLIAVNYMGQRGQLASSNDATRRMAQFLIEKFNFDRGNMVCLTEDQTNPMSQPIKTNIIRAVHWLVKDSNANDSLFLYYFGHGGTSPNYGQVIYPTDFRTQGHITDEELHNILVAGLPAGARLSAVFDSFHSACPLDLPFIYTSSGLDTGRSRLHMEGGAKSVAAGAFLSLASQHSSGRLGKSKLGSILKKFGKPEKDGGVDRSNKSGLADVVVWYSERDLDGVAANNTDAKEGIMSETFVAVLGTETMNQTFRQVLDRIHHGFPSTARIKVQMSCGTALRKFAEPTVEWSLTGTARK